LDEFERFIAVAPDTLGFTAKSVVQWWIQPSQQEAYPLLSQHALDVLSAPSVSAESERIFSGARRTISWSRSQLSSPVIEALECLKHWQVTDVVEDDFVIRVPESEDSRLAENDSGTSTPVPVATKIEATLRACVLRSRQHDAKTFPISLHMTRHKYEHRFSPLNMT
jgi:hypothetical protein